MVVFLLKHPMFPRKCQMFFEEQQVFPKAMFHHFCKQVYIRKMM